MAESRRRVAGMSRRHELEQRLRKLGEIGEIMRSMKNLALMETRKLARFLDVQQESVQMLEEAAADFLHFYPLPTPPQTPQGQALLVIGSERGFCGDFNDELLRGLPANAGEGQAAGGVLLLAVGSKLNARLASRPDSPEPLAGPAVAEDVPETLNRLVPTLGRLQETPAGCGLTVLHHRSGADGLECKPLLPPFTRLTGGTPRHRHPPLLNLEPGQCFAQLVRHYLFAALHEIFYTSLMAENQRRIQHVEGAIQRLEEKTGQLARQSHILRQEEITEEIEVILLSVEESGLAQARSASLPKA